MRVAIIGGGSIGLLFAYYLNQKHHVTLYVRNQRQMELLRTNGLFLHKKGQTFRTDVETRDITEWGNHGEDVSIICVKQYHLPALLDGARLPGEHSLLFVQNGMGHLKMLEKLKNRDIFVATIEHGALRLAENEVNHTGEGITRIAPFRGNNQRLIEKLISPLERTFPFVKEEDYYRMLVKKLVVNAVINPLTAILRVPNGQLLDNPRYFELVKMVFAEVNTILELDDEEAYFNNLLQVCRTTANNRSSMLKDLEERRPTEVDAILGYLLEKAEEKNLPAPHAAMLYNMIKGSELQIRGE